MRRAEWWLLDHWPPAKPEGLSLPPAKLRFRVSENAGAGDFLTVGRRTAGNLLAALDDAGFLLEQGSRVLDFGCGCGRTLLWLAPLYPGVVWHGADVDGEAIAWCAKHLPRGKFVVNNPLPPLAFEDGQFDLIYGISVFTHLSETYQQAWLAELKRVLKPGGLLLLSFYSRHIVPAEDAAAVAEGEFVFRTSGKWKGVLPDWYHTALQGEPRIRRMFRDAGFGNPIYIERRFGDQDAVAVRRAAATPAR